MVPQQEAEDDWDQGIPQTQYQLPAVTAKELLRVMSILKNYEIPVLKIKLGFYNQFCQTVFTQMMRAEQNDEHFRDVGNRKENFYATMLKKKQSGFKQNGFIFEIGSLLRSLVFLKAYKDNKLHELQRNCNIKVHHFGKDLYIESESKVKKGSIIHSELLDMYKRLKLYTFFNDQRLWQIVNNSEEFKKRLQKIGIECYASQGKRCHVVFYSADYEPEQIRKEVLRQNSFKPMVLRLSDQDLSLKDNSRIFDIVLKSIRGTIDIIRNTYEANLEVNKNTSSFVLHLKNQIFADEPLLQISKAVSNLLIISFPLRNSRAFINLVSRNSKHFSFIQASHYNKTAFCCIDKTKVKSKKDILSVFAPFFEEFDQNSRLNIHLKPNCVLQRNANLPSNILQLSQECNLQVENYSEIADLRKFNVTVKPRLFNTADKKSQKQLQMSQFLVKILLTQEKQKQLTHKEFKESLTHGNLLALSESTNDSTQRQRAHRGNREKNAEGSAIAIAEERRGGRGERRREQIGSQNQQHKQKESASRDANGSRETRRYELKVAYKRPEGSSKGELYRKERKDRDVEESLQSREGIKVKCWRLTVDLEAYGWNEEREHTLQKQACFMVQQIGSNGKVPESIKLVRLAELEDQQIGYLVFRAAEEGFWIPTHMVQRF